MLSPKWGVVLEGALRDAAFALYLAMTREAPPVRPPLARCIGTVR